MKEKSKTAFIFKLNNDFKSILDGLFIQIYDLLKLVNAVYQFNFLCILANDISLFQK